MDFCLLEPDSNTATLASCIAELAVARAKNKTVHADPPSVHLITSVPIRNGESRSSLTFRQELVNAARSELRPMLDVHISRQLKRFKTNSEEELLELAAQVPQAPDLPAVLHEALRASGQRSHKNTTSNVITPTVSGTIDASTATPIEAPSHAKKRCFELDVPGPLCLLSVSTKGAVVVAPSLNVPDSMGLYPARKYLEGQVICTGTSAEGGWTLAQHQPCPPPKLTLMLKLHHQFFQTKDAEAQLVGDPMRHAWANMNSSEGLGIKHNVIAVFGKKKRWQRENGPELPDVHSRPRYRTIRRRARLAVPEVSEERRSRTRHH